MSDDGFLSRWSRKKVEAKRAVEPAPIPPPGALPGVSTEPPVAGRLGEAMDPSAKKGSGDGASSSAGVEPVAQTPRAMREPSTSREGATASEGDEPLPSMDDVAGLTTSSDFTRYMAPKVDESVKRAALKKLFADPHFNVMDGLDTYIDDYSQPDPIPLAMLRRMAQSQALGLFDDEESVEREMPSDLPPEAHEQVDGETLAQASEQPLEPPPLTKASTDGGGATGLPQLDQLHPAVPPDEDPDLRLQQDHAARCGGAGEGTSR